jgi:hypothetical protein
MGDKFFPSFNVIEGDKQNPTDIGGGYQILKDNVLLEGNIPPAKSKEEFIHNMKYIKNYFSEVLKNSDIKGLSLECADSGEFDAKYLRHWEANLFGCSPYNNCWDGEEHIADDMSHMNFRVAGGHIHIGFDKVDGSISNEKLNLLIAKAFDYFIVYPARCNYNDPIRSKYYGSYGNYRDKPYGLECRSLGGYFLKDEYLGWIYDNIMKMIDFINSEDGKSIEKLIAIENNPLNFNEENYKILNVDLDDLKFKL